MTSSHLGQPSERTSRATGRRGRAGLLLLGLGLAGCGYQSESERAYFEGREVERQQKMELRNTLSSTVSDTEALTMIQTSPAPDGFGTIQDWIGRKRLETPGQIMLPRWNVQQFGDRRFEVRYTYTMIDESNQLVRSGYRWNVDTAIKQIPPPQSFTVSNAAPPQINLMSQQRQKRIEIEEASLE